MNHRLELLEPYPFSKLQALLADAQPEGREIKLSVGEPQHAPPDFVLQTLADALPELAHYPATAGTPALRNTIADWLRRRFDLADVDGASQILPVTGTREALFAFAQAVVNPDGNALVLSPNPFYQIYEGAALLAGAQPCYLNCTQASGFLPDFDEVPDDVWSRTQLLYICTPGNPTGAVMQIETLQKLIELAHEHDFIIASDECYSEIYRDEGNPPPGLLQAAAMGGDTEYRRCIVFHSLSKRSNLPGLRSGFVAGDAAILRDFLRYRTYHGCAMPPHHQLASIAAWGDESHVVTNRQAYNAKFAAVCDVLATHLEVEIPDAGFYLWPHTPLDDTEFARDLFIQKNVVVLPGSYLGRTVGQINPGSRRIRMALVAPLDDCVEAAQRIAQFCEQL